jgi:hypothetical protein
VEGRKEVKGRKEGRKEVKGESKRKEVRKEGIPRTLPIPTKKDMTRMKTGEVGGTDWWTARWRWCRGE